MGRRKKKEPLSLLLRPENVLKESCAMTRDFAYMQITHNDMTQWSKLQKQLFMLALEEIDWTRKGNSNVIELDHKEIAFRLGWDYSPENERKIKQVIEEEISQMHRNSYVKLKDPVSGTWYSDHIIASAGGNSLMTRVVLGQLFMNHFEGMYQTQKETGLPFPVIMSTDVLSFKSNLTYDFYLKLRLEGAVGGAINTKELSTAEIKKILHMTEKSYTREVVDKKTGEKKVKFDRTNFEKHVLTIILEDINNGETIQIVPTPDGKLFEKVYLRGQVYRYIIRYRIFDINDIKRHRKKLLKENKKTEDITAELAAMTPEEFNAFIKNELASEGDYIETELADNVDSCLDFQLAL